MRLTRLATCERVCYIISMHPLCESILNGFDSKFPQSVLAEARKNILADKPNGLKREAALAVVRDLETIASADWGRDKLVTLQGGLLVRWYTTTDGLYREIRINIENCVPSIPRHDLTIPVNQAPSNVEIERHLVTICLGALEVLL